LINMTLVVGYGDRQLLTTTTHHASLADAAASARKTKKRRFTLICTANFGHTERFQLSACADLFFVYSLLACDLSRSWRGYVQSVSCPPSVQWRLVASAPLPSALRLGLSQRDMIRTKEMTKERKRPKKAV
jgi:hypothetical protein